MLRILLLTVCCFTVNLYAKESVDDSLSVELPALGAIKGKTSISGLSSGGFMAAQYHVAYSKELVGAGIVAGGPWNCADSLPNAFVAPIVNAVSTCMDPCKYSWFFCFASQYPDSRYLVDLAKGEANLGGIDPLENLVDDKVYIFSGKDDETVVTGVVDTTEAFYRLLDIPNDAIRYNKTVNAGHAFITADMNDSACAVTQPPYINNCGFEQSERILNHIYGPLNAPNKALSGKLIKFNQKAFIQGDLSSMDEEAYLYVPRLCEEQSCKVHVAVHGCNQGISVIGTRFVTGTGYNQIADSNGIIVLYPQVKKSEVFPVNPRGCWDFWGYSSNNLPPYNYFKKTAPQMEAIHLMVERLTSQR